MRRCVYSARIHARRLSTISEPPPIKTRNLLLTAYGTSAACLFVGSMFLDGRAAAKNYKPERVYHTKGCAAMAKHAVVLSACTSGGVDRLLWSFAFIPGLIMHHAFLVVAEGVARLVTAVDAGDDDSDAT